MLRVNHKGERMSDIPTSDSYGFEHVLLELKIRPGYEAEYDHRHDEIWPDLVVAIHDSGIREMRIFRHEQSVSVYAVCQPDAATAFARLRLTGVDRRWQTHMADVYADHPTVTFLPQVWVLP